MNSIVASVLVCAITAGLSPLFFRRLLRRSGIIDTPNKRSSHVTPVLRGAGLSTMTGVIVGGLFAQSSAPLWIVLGFGAAMGAVGFIDDVRSLTARLRFSTQLLLGLLLGAVIMIEFHASPVVILPIAIAFAAFVNMTNFMDGADGISSLYGAVAGASYMVIGFIADQEWLVATGALVGVAFLVFLPWNILGSRMFLGDCGSYLLGASIVAMSMCATFSGVAWPAALAPLAIYATDTSLAITARVLRGERWWEAHRQHQYQQMIDAGAPHLGAAAIVAVFGLVTAAAGALSLTDSPQAFPIAIGSVVLCCLLYVSVARIVVTVERKEDA